MRFGKFAIVVTALTTLTGLTTEYLSSNSHRVPYLPTYLPTYLMVLKEIYFLASEVGCSSDIVMVSPVTLSYTV